MSQSRLQRYLVACGGDTRKAMTLYRQNLKLSQVLFTVVSCFEIALRNRIDNIYTQQHGSQWITDSIAKGGFLASSNCEASRKIVQRTRQDIGSSPSHAQMLANLSFGFWRFLFAKHQFKAGGAMSATCLSK